MTKILLLHNTLDHDMITTEKIPDPTILLLDAPIVLPIDMTLIIDMNHVTIQEIKNIFTKYTSSYRPPSTPREF